MAIQDAEPILDNSATLPDDGQEGLTGDLSPEPESYFFSTKLPGDDGEEGLNFKDQDELSQWIKDNHLRRSDYTKKTQEVAESRRAFLTEKELFAQQLRDFEDKKKGYSIHDEMNEFLTQNPDVFNELKQRLEERKRLGLTGQVPMESIEKMMEERFGPDIQAFKDWQRERKTAEQRESALGPLKEKYEDFDEKLIDEEFNKLKQAGDLGTLYEILYHSLKGRNANPAKAEEDVLAKIEKNKKAGILPAKGGKVGTPTKEVGSIDALRAELTDGL